MGIHTSINGKGIWQTHAFLFSKGHSNCSRYATERLSKMNMTGVLKFTWLLNYISSQMFNSIILFFKK